MKEMRITWMETTSIELKKKAATAQNGVSCKVGMLPTIEKADEDHFAAHIAISASAEGLFELNFVSSAGFEIERYEESQEEFEGIIQTALGAVYPYARNTLSQLLSLASIQPIYLPIINVMDAFSKDKVKVVETPKTSN